jgi:hypothetical protein
MSAIEGLRRKRLGSLIAIWGSLAGLLAWCSVFFVRHSFGIGELVFLVGIPLLFGGMLRVIAWVVVGFAAGPDRANDG